MFMRTFDTHVKDTTIACRCFLTSYDGLNLPLLAGFNRMDRKKSFKNKKLFCAWFQSDAKSVFYNVMSVTSLAVLSEFTSLSEPVTWEAGLCPGGLCPHTTANNVTPLLAYHAYPNSDLSLIAADLGHRSVSKLSDSSAALAEDGIEKKYKGETLLFSQVHKVGLYSTWLSLS